MFLNYVCVCVNFPIDLPPLKWRHSEKYKHGADFFLLCGFPSLEFDSVCVAWEAEEK